MNMTEYNGYKNMETWNVATLLSNTEAYYLQVKKLRSPDAIRDYYLDLLMMEMVEDDFDMGYVDWEEVYDTIIGEGE